MNWKLPIEKGTILAAPRNVAVPKPPLAIHDGDLYVRYRQELMKRGVFEIPMNLKRNHVSFSHTEGDIDWTLGVAEEALGAAFDARAAGEI